ncbi:P-loop containing nucleoside triphosphate hydrolase protein [Pholiota molesta]|nr:P-loop containing nucleoside triphosphate hydrolase protein [Pholiota molesta]
MDSIPLEESNPSPPSSPPPPRVWTIQEIRNLVQRVFKKRPCWFQIKVALALHAGKDVIACAPTGAGKTLSFWIPLLMALEEGKDKLTIVVTPLNLLGKQNVESLKEAGLSAISVSSENNNSQTFNAIENGKYRVITINPEILMNNTHTDNLWKKPIFTQRILNIIFDEGHCISQWGSFRNEYRNIGALRYLLPNSVSFYVPSATLPSSVLLDITNVLRLKPNNTEHIICSNDRPDISLVVRGLTFPANSFRDLAFLIPEGFREGDSPPDKFLIFFDNRIEAENACIYLASRLPITLRSKIKWFHSLNTGEYRVEELERMKNDQIWGFCCTDSFGMGMDLPGIKLIIQWKATCSLCTLWQRFGRAARGAGQTAIGVLFVEKKDTDEVRTLKATREADRQQKKDGVGTKRKATDQLNKDAGAKRPALDGSLTVNRVAGGVGVPETRPDLEGSSAIVDHAAEGGGVRAGGISASILLQMNERRAHYAKREPIARSVVQASTVSGKGKGVEVGSAMDDFINTPCEFKCRRIVPKLYFGNDKTPTNYHLLCDPEFSTGCSRCKPRALTLCCDLCQPDAFAMFDPTNTDKAARAPSKSHVKAAEPTENSQKLQAALFDWREQNARIKFDAEILQDMGSFIFLSNQLISRIIDCARADKIGTVALLFKETAWRKEWVEEFGESLLAVAHSFYPAKPISDPAAASTRRKPRAPSKCSACGEIGHNSM